jgi:uncharacterized protein YndB with AHSA1/START domain
MARTNETILELRGDREIVIERTFNAPAAIVFEAWTRPELVQRWWAPRTFRDVMLTCEADVRPGGRYRYVMQAGAGRRMAFSGRYLEVSPPSRLVHTQIFEPAAAGPEPDAPAITVTVTFEDRGGRTHVVSHTVCPTSELRDTIIASGMETGMRQTMDQLDELVELLAADS